MKGNDLPHPGPRPKEREEHPAWDKANHWMSVPGTATGVAPLGKRVRVEGELHFHFNPSGQDGSPRMNDMDHPHDFSMTRTIARPSGLAAEGVSANGFTAR